MEPSVPTKETHVAQGPPARSHHEDDNSGHHHWDPGGVRAFPDSTGARNSPQITHIFSGAPPSVGKRDGFATDEDQRVEPSGAVGSNNKTEDDKRGPVHDQTGMVQTDEGGSVSAANNDSEGSHDKVHEAGGAELSASEEPVLFVKSETVVVRDDGASVIPEIMSLPVIGDASYVLGLRPDPCKEQIDNKEELVTGMLLFHL